MFAPNHIANFNLPPGVSTLDIEPEDVEEIEERMLAAADDKANLAKGDRED